MATFIFIYFTCTAVVLGALIWLCSPKDTKFRPGINQHLVTDLWSDIPYSSAVQVCVKAFVLMDVCYTACQSFHWEENVFEGICKQKWIKHHNMRGYRTIKVKKKIKDFNWAYIILGEGRSYKKGRLHERTATQ